MIQALADRRATEATPVLLQTAASQEASVRTASYRALGELAGAGEAETLVALLVKAAGAEQPQLENAILRVARRANATAQISKAILAKLDSVGDARLKGTMIGILGQLGDASALATLRRAPSDTDTEVRYAAIAGLGHWPDATPLPDLLRIASDKGSGGAQVRALRAYLDVLGTVASMGPQEKVRNYQTALGLAPDAATKKRILAALANVKTVEAMQLAASCVQDEQVKEEAALATVDGCQRGLGRQRGPGEGGSGTGRGGQGQEHHEGAGPEDAGGNRGDAELPDELGGGRAVQREREELLAVVRYAFRAGGAECSGPVA